MSTLYGEKLSVIVESLPETCRDFPNTHMKYKNPQIWFCSSALLLYKESAQQEESVWLQLLL